MTRRDLLGLGIAGLGLDVEAAPARPFEPGQPGEYFVHTWILDFVRMNRAGEPTYRVVHTSEGPLDGQATHDRVREIAREGMLIGTHFWPLDKVLRVVVLNS